MNESLDWVLSHNKEHHDEYANFVRTNKYLAILMPGHYLARADGYVYLHHLQAERLLKRKLLPGECVHHVDGNKFNNSVDNLLVFRSNSDHISFHSGCEIEQDGDVWIAKRHVKSTCPICGNTKDFKANLCLACFLESKSSHIPSKEHLRNLLITHRSLSSIAKEYDVSYTAIKRWCIKYGLPYRRSDLSSLTETS